MALYFYRAISMFFRPNVCLDKREQITITYHIQVPLHINMYIYRSHTMEEGMRRCADQVDCGYDNRDSDLFCRACALPLLDSALSVRYVVEAL